MCQARPKRRIASQNALTAADAHGNHHPNFVLSGENPMSTKADRGTKRTCQNAECGSRFYDLNRDPVVCPICQTAYQIEASPTAMTAVAPAVAEKAAQRRPAAKKPVYPVEPTKPEEAPEGDADAELAAIEGDEEPAVADEDETFLEAEEEDGSDMSNIIGGPVAETDEQQ
jgi:uncharacterized protein (TIGR02300 family)